MGRDTSGGAEKRMGGCKTLRFQSGSTGRLVGTSFDCRAAAMTFVDCQLCFVYEVRKTEGGEEGGQTRTGILEKGGGDRSQ